MSFLRLTTFLHVDPDRYSKFKSTSEKILSGVGKSAVICDVMDRQTANSLGALSPPTVELPTLVYLAHPSFKAPSSVVFEFYNSDLIQYMN